MWCTDMDKADTPDPLGSQSGKRRVRIIEQKIQWLYNRAAHLRNDNVAEMYITEVDALRWLLNLVKQQQKRLNVLNKHYKKEQLEVDQLCQENGGIFQKYGIK